MEPAFIDYGRWYNGIFNGISVHYLGCHWKLSQLDKQFNYHSLCAEYGTKERY